jgi:CHAD domain-containing protein
VQAGGGQVDLSPTMTPRAALCAVLQNLHGVVEANTEGTRAAIDTEFLHDYRVALRRTRVLLSRSESVFATPEVGRLAEELKWLVDLTNPVRDLDVFIQWLGAYAAPAPADLRRQYAAIDALLQEQRTGLQHRLSRALEGPRYAALMEAWHQMIQEGQAPDGSDAGRTILGVASGWIWMACRRAYRMGKAITDETPDADLHELRLDCKKLRYLIEPFKSLYPGEPCEQILSSLKALQDVLGEHQDLSVQLSMLHHLDRKGRRPPGIDFEATASLSRLNLYLPERKKTVRSTFREAFNNFSQRETRRLFKQLFK